MSDNTHQELAANMARWREQLAAARNVAVHSLENCEGMSVPARYNLLASAVREIRGLVRPEPRTAGFLEEKSWYESTSPHFKDVLRRKGMLPPADLPPVNLPAGADGTEPGGEPRARDGGDHMSKVDAAKILAVLAAGRTRTEDEVTALEMGARRLCARWFQEQRRWARRRARKDCRLKNEDLGLGAEPQSSILNPQSSIKKGGEA